ncbi:unnamed protein product [Blepharisma stoltei]|uniref:Uncharacterized protein n=1 Tax=Blepharisma stoltei TaxID=1481888 RepID=A0AAU9I7Z4_9CILI|nr:unnamed protein product [Blepharisma stoltei]
MSNIFDKQISALNTALTSLQQKLQQEAITELYEDTENDVKTLNERYHKLKIILQTHQTQLANLQDLISTKVKLIDSLKHKQNSLKEKLGVAAKASDESRKRVLPKSPISDLHDNSEELSGLQKCLEGIEEMFYKLDAVNQKPLCKNCTLLIN